MPTSSHANVPASGNTPKVCPYTSLGHTRSENYYFSLTLARHWRLGELILNVGENPGIIGSA